jgi:hypothetical protein
MGAFCFLPWSFTLGFGLTLLGLFGVGSFWKGKELEREKNC